MSQILSHLANANQPAADRRPDPHAGRNAAARAAPRAVIGDDYDPDLFGVCCECRRRFRLRDDGNTPSHVSPPPCRSYCPGSGRRPWATDAGVTSTVPPPVVIDPIRGQVLDLADASEAPAAPDVLTLGMLAAGSPYFPDVPDCVPPAYAADWLSDAGRCELAAVPPLLARLEREAPGTNCRVAVSFGVSRLADGTTHFDRRPGWELTAWRGKETYNGSGHDLERLAACCAARFRR